VSTYVLPRRLADQLEGALAGSQYKAEAMRLATFLGRFWSAPGKLGQAFHVDRRALADRTDLGLSEKRVRRALEALKAVGFLKIQEAKGSAYRMTEDGLRRKPSLYRFGAEWWRIFASVCRKAARAVRQAVLQVAGHGTPVSRPRALRGQISAGPKSTREAESGVYMGPAPAPSESNPALESALDRLLLGIRLSRGSGEGGAR
jgi:hypothetical protein